MATAEHKTEPGPWVNARVTTCEGGPETSLRFILCYEYTAEAIKRASDKITLVFQEGNPSGREEDTQSVIKSDSDRDRTEQLLHQSRGRTGPEGERQQWEWEAGQLGKTSE